MLKRDVIERDIPGAGAMSARYSEGMPGHRTALRQMDCNQCVHPFVTRDESYRNYLAGIEELIHGNARIARFPADPIPDVECIIDPATRHNCAADIVSVSKRAGQAMGLFAKLLPAPSQ